MQKRKQKNYYTIDDEEEENKRVNKVRYNRAKIKKFTVRNENNELLKEKLKNAKAEHEREHEKKVKIIKFGNLAEEENNTNYSNKKIQRNTKHHKSFESLKPEKNKTMNSSPKKIKGYLTGKGMPHTQRQNKNTKKDKSLKKIILHHSASANDNSRAITENTFNLSEFGDIESAKENLKKRLIEINSSLNVIRYYNGPVDIRCISTNNFENSIESLQIRLRFHGYRCIKCIDNLLTFTNDYNILYVEIVKIRNGLLYYLITKKKILLYQTKK